MTIQCRPCVSPATLAAVATFGVLALAGCASGPPVFLATGGSASELTEGSVTPGEARLKASVCNGESLKPEFEPLDEAALVSFLTAHGYRTRSVRARSDLVYVDVLNAASHVVRLRVAILPNPPAAGLELHEAMLQHGPGSWGVHRSNLAVLAPIGSPDEVLSFAVKTKLACWGVLTMAGRDDTFVTPGGYVEL